MSAKKKVTSIAALALLAFVCQAATGSDAEDNPATPHAITVNANGDNAEPLPDFDGDGTVGFSDFLIFAGVFGSGQGDEKYDARYDLNGDGEIGFSDFLIFAQNFGKVVPSPVVAIQGANLRAAIADALGKAGGAPITQADMASLTSLTASQAGTSDLAVLEFATNLTTLDLRDNDIADISPLAGLTNLTTLDLWGNNIADISALAGLTNLTTLDLWGNNIADISALAGLTNLTTLDLWGNNIADISPLAGLTNLTTLDLWGNNIADISALAGLTNLTYLNLWANNIADISPLAGLTNLTTLDLRSNDITDISPLAGLTNLTDLYLWGNDITDISALAGLTNLTYLNLGANDIADISALAGLTNLTDLYLRGNDIADISPLAGLTNLTDLYLRSNDITDISALAGLTNLTDLDLRGNDIADISPLAGLTNLTYLNLAGNNISDVAPLAANTGLGRGDRVDVTSNPLNTESIGSQIPALQARGIEISFDEIVVFTAPQIYNDNVFVLPVAEYLPAFRFPTRDYAARFYEYFSDAFDFLIFMPNLITAQLDHEVSIADFYAHVGNNVRGIGLDVFFDDSWGSAGKLQGAIFSSSAAYSTTFDHTRLIRGNTLHELMHRWGNYIVRPYLHFGDTSSNGQLGGFDIATLVDHGGGLYSADWGPSYKGYSPIELYLAGYIPPEDVPDLVVAEDLEGRPDKFTVSRFKTYTIENIIAEHGPRVPDHSQAQKDFRAAVILLISEEFPATRWILETLSNDVTLFSHAGGNQFEWYNFYEATGDRGTITMDGLSQFKRRAGANKPAPRSFGTVPPPIVDRAP